ncbi:hypothetical protein OIO90_000377 [Microbotryomycetes sp. JL221]|nr:hypothetical protein OIO90_000377 [Microbotryomycetes sp. JL221]
MGQTRQPHQSHVTHLNVTGIDDLRLKFFIGQGHLESLRLVSSSFKPHSLIHVDSLPLFLKRTSLIHLSNLGLPEPSTHALTLIKLCSTNLTSLSLSSLRDMTTRLFRQLLQVLIMDCTNLYELRFGALLSEQMLTLTEPLTLTTSPTETHSSSPLTNMSQTRQAALQSLPIKQLTLTIPHINLELLTCLPLSIETLNLRTSPGLSSILSTRIINSDQDMNLGPVPIQQLEEESHIAYILSQALMTTSNVMVAPQLQTVTWEGSDNRRQQVERKLRQALDRAGRRHINILTNVDH